MKILKKGVLKEPKFEFKGTCPSCGTIFLCKENEVVFEEDRGQDHPTCTCPTLGCKTKIYLKNYKTRQKPSR